MNPLLVAGAIGIAGAIVALVASWRRGAGSPDLGSVSQHWIAEHRLGSGQD